MNIQTKQEYEKIIFKAFIDTEPNFAGEPIMSWSGGVDPPEFLCETKKGRRIGIELTEWLHPSQTQRARAREDLQEQISRDADKYGFTGFLGQYNILLHPAKMELPLSRYKRGY